jgi:septal ring factor EnvC (AmiA/AmiB activator)
MAKQLKDLQHQVAKQQAAQQESLQHRKAVEQQLVKLQEENETLQEQLEESSHRSPSSHWKSS